MKKLILTLACFSVIGCAGEKGSTGPQGAPGQDGSSCSVSQLANGALIECTNGTSALLSNGVDGQDAVLPPGYQYIPEGAFFISAIEDLCGSGAQEILLRLSDNRLVAHYSHGNKQYLALLDPGNYISTDGYNCNFTVGPAPNYLITY